MFRRSLRRNAMMAARATTKTTPMITKEWLRHVAPKLAGGIGVVALAGPMLVGCEAEPVTGLNFPGTLNGLSFAGAGVRIKYMFVKVYAVGLYVEAKNVAHLRGASAETVATALCSPDLPKIIRIVMARDLSAEKYTAAIVEALEPRMPNARRVIEQFKSLNPEGPMRTGTEVVMELRDNKLYYMIGGHTLGTIESRDLTAALGDIYYGADCVSLPARDAACERIAKGL